MSLSEIFSTVLRASCLGGAVVVLLLLTRWLAGKALSPAWRCWLWLPVAALFIAPRLPDFGWHWQGAALPEMMQKAVEADAPPSPVNASALSAARSVAPHQGISIASSFALREWLAAIWISVAAGLFALWVTSYAWLLRRVRRGGIATPESLRTLLVICAREVGLRNPPRCIVSDTVESPAVAGLFCPCVLVPQSLSTLLDEQELRLVLLHEMEHLKRRDLWFHWLSALLLAVHWFNPLLWLASWLFRADREAACDAAVLASRREDARGLYGDTLLKLQANFARALPLRPMIGVLGGADMLRQRILDIAHHGRGSLWAGLGALLIVAGAAGSMAIVAGETPSALQSHTVSSIEEADQDSRAPLKLDHEELLRRIDALAGVVERQIYINTKIVTLGKDDKDVFPPELLVLGLKAESPQPATPAATAPDDKVMPAPGIISLAGVFTDPQYQVVIRALSQKKNVQLLSSPSVTTRNGQRAVVEMLKMVRYPTEFKPGANGQPATVVQTNEQPIGWSLGIEPVIEPDGSTMDLNITVENSAFEKWETYGPGVKQPQIHHSKTTTSVTVWDGQTICLGGEAYVHDPESFANLDPVNPPAARPCHVLVFVTPKMIDPSGRPGSWKEEDNQGIVIPELRLQEVTLAEAVSQIYDLAKKHDRRGKGINLMLRNPESNAARVTLNTGAIKISELMDLLAKLAHLDLQVEGHTVLLIPQAEQKSAGVFRKVPVKIGPKSFLKDDSIEILEVTATSSKLEPGDEVIVKGRGHLGSHPGAKVCLFTTQIQGSGSEKIDDSQVEKVQAGNTYLFELSCIIRKKGYLHVSYYDLETGNGFGGVYFGTPEQMEEFNVVDPPPVR